MNNKQVFRDFLKYVSFNILGQIAYSCYTLADTFFVSADIGTNGLTALNLAFPVFCIISGAGLMIGIGSSSRFSILKSCDEPKAADQVFTNALILVLVFASLFFCSGVFASHHLVKILGADSQVFEITNLYLKVLMVFAPAFMLNHVLQSFVRNDGAPSLSMAAMITGSFSNIILDYLFIFPLRMGIFGAALATGLSPVISMLVLLPHFVKKKNGFHLTRPDPAQVKRNTGTILSNGTPPFLTEAASGIVMFLFNSIILRISGNVGVAAFGVISVISLVVIALYTGLSQGMQPLISQYHGAGKHGQVQILLRAALITSILLSLTIYGIIFFYTPQLVSVFNREQDLILAGYAVPGLKLYFMACPFIGFNIVLSTYYISINHPLPAQIISVLRSFFVLIPMAWFLSSLWGMTGVWLAYPATEILVFFFALTKKPCCTSEV